MQRGLAFGLAALWLAISAVSLAEDGQPAAPAQAGETDAAQPVEEHDIAPWQPQLKSVRDQLNLLDLFAKATQFGGVSIHVPEEIQHVPLDQFEGMEKWAKRVDLYVKEIRFENIEFERKEELFWEEERPSLPALMRFGQFGASIDAKTRLGTVPVEADLREGALPLDFALQEAGYDILFTPERRAKEAQIGKVDIDMPVAGGLVNRFFGKKVAQLVLESVAGQTLKMGRGGLLGGKGLPTGLLGGEAGKVLNDPAVKGLLDSLL